MPLIFQLASSKQNTSFSVWPITTLLFLLLLCSCEVSQKESTTQPETATEAYHEPHRPQFHFSPPANWMNDPNGMVFYEGEYHLFYQYYPDSTVWGPMHWGHAISTDLIHWEHLPIALYPDELGYIFSGSAVIDWNNTSGFGTEENPPMIAIFTHHDMEKEQAKKENDYQYQSIAYSVDKGRSWTKYAGNPVVPNEEKIKDFRDPKVIWDEYRQQWVMVFAAWDHVKIYGSPDLKNWTHLSDFGKAWGSHAGVWECPDLFPITMEETGENYWVLLQSMGGNSHPNGGSSTQYFVGNFDGKEFTVDEEFASSVTPEKLIENQSVNEGERMVWLDYGRDNYAGVTWSDIPKTDGRRIFLGWMSNWDYAQIVPTETWRSAMTVPLKLTLHESPNGPRLRLNPVEELENLRGEIREFPAIELAAGNELVLPTQELPITGAFELNISIDTKSSSNDTELSIKLENTQNEFITIAYHQGDNAFYLDRRSAGKTAFSEKFAAKRSAGPLVDRKESHQLRLLFDVSSVELFVDGGQLIMTEVFFPNEPFSKAAISVTGSGTVKVSDGVVYPLERIW